MAKYSVKVIDMTVHRWGEDGQGDYVCSKGGFELGTYSTLDAAKAAIDEHFGYELHPDDYQDDFINASLIEDIDANADPDGEYLVDYVLCIDKIERVCFAEAPDWAEPA